MWRCAAEHVRKDALVPQGLCTVRKPPRLGMGKGGSLHITAQHHAASKAVTARRNPL